MNLYPRQVEASGEPAALVLDSAPGMNYCLGSSGAVRAMFSTGSRLFAVQGSSPSVLHEYEASGTTVAELASRGNLVTTSGYVSIANNETQLAITDGPNLYILDLTTNAFSTVGSSGWRGSAWIDYLDGYFIAVAPDSNQFYISAIDDGTSWDPLDFSSADASPDKLVTLRVLKHELFLFGETSTEVWVNSGDADFPFTRYQSVPIDVGIVGNTAAVRTTDSIFWVGQNKTGRGQVYYMNGHQPVRVSTQAVEEALATSTDLSQCYSWTYLLKGNEFVGFEAPGMESAWVYDVSTQLWHERARLIAGEWAGYSLSHVVGFNGYHFGQFAGQVCKLDPDLYYHKTSLLATEPLARERTWPHLVAPSNDPLTFRLLELNCTTGHGGNITLECSNDGGFTWGSVLLKSLGATGRWMQRVRWLFLGSARDRVFRLRCTDDVPLTIHSALVDAS